MESGTAGRRGDLYLAMLVAVAWLIIMALAASLWLRPWPDVLFRTDFVAFWTGGAMVGAGAEATLFDMAAQSAFQQQARLELATTEEMRRAVFRMPYYGPPPLALLFVPLGQLPLPWAYLLWMPLSLLAFVAAIALALRGRPFAMTLSVVLITFSAVAATLLEGQVNGLFLLALSLGLLCLMSGRPLLGGALLGLLWLKPQYALLFALVFATKRRWQEMAGMAATGLAVAALSVAMVGIEGLAVYLEELRRIGAFHPLEASLSPWAMANWRALLMNRWPAIPEALGAILVPALGAGTAAFSLLAWRGAWDPASPRFPRQMLVTAMATIIASPHSHFHGAVLLLGPLALSLARPSHGMPLESIWRWALALGYLLALVVFPLRELSWLLVPYLLASMVLLTLQCQAASRGLGADKKRR